MWWGVFISVWAYGVVQGVPYFPTWSDHSTLTIAQIDKKYEMISGDDEIRLFKKLNAEWSKKKQFN
jgi:hypothetical protein